MTDSDNEAVRRRLEDALEAVYGVTFDGAAILAADPQLAEALETGLALLAVQEALPEWWRLTSFIYNAASASWWVYAESDRRIILSGKGETVAAAARNLAARLKEEKK